jgi:predicted RNase H-like nuclease (RuvC/YqgF family)
MSRQHSDETERTQEHMSTKEIVAEIKKCEAEIANLEAYLGTLRTDVDNMHPHSMERVRVRQEIKRSQEKIDNLRKRLDGIPLSDVTDEQVRLSDHALSDEYNDE